MTDERKNNEPPPEEFGEGGGEREPGGGGPPGEGGGESLNQGRPAVASAPGKVLILIVLAVVFLIIVIHSLFFGSSTPPAASKKPGKVTIANAAPPPISPDLLPPPPSLPGAVPTPLPPPPTPLPPPVAVPPPPAITAQSGPTNEQLAARNKAPMLAGGLSAQVGNKLAEKKKTAPSSDPNYAFAQSIADSKTETVEATEVKNLGRTLVQGKLIQGVLETAIDSELPGDIRAIVSHDIYAESGRAILVPKGSRIVGTYNSSIKRGQARVFIIWQRIVRPDGVDVAINSPGVDALGRAGMTGFVDNKYFEAFSTALLTSVLDIGVAAAGDQLLGNGVSTITSNGVTTQTLSNTGIALQQAEQSIGSVGQSIVTSTVNLQPTIHVDQGELINIFVNKDVVFPPGLQGVAGFIP